MAWVPESFCVSARTAMRKPDTAMAAAAFRTDRQSDSVLLRTRKAPMQAVSRYTLCHVAAGEADSVAAPPSGGPLEGRNSCAPIRSKVLRRTARASAEDGLTALTMPDGNGSACNAAYAGKANSRSVRAGARSRAFPETATPNSQAATPSKARRQTNRRAQASAQPNSHGAASTAARTVVRANRS